MKYIKSKDTEVRLQPDSELDSDWEDKAHPGIHQQAPRNGPPSKGRPRSEVDEVDQARARRGQAASRSVRLCVSVCGLLPQRRSLNTRGPCQIPERMPALPHVCLCSLMTDRKCEAEPV